jgi:hypothetical protein
MRKVAMHEKRRKTSLQPVHALSSIEQEKKNARANTSLRTTFLFLEERARKE